jgi:putative ABC transport system permease protein
MAGLQTVGSALPALGLVAVAVLLSFYERLGLEKDIGVAVVRSCVQLAAIGYVIDYIFGLDNLGVVALLLAGMVLFAAWTSARRAGNVPKAFLIAAFAVGVAAVATLGLLLALGIVPATARYLIPLGGMVIGNSMNAASLTMTRIRDDVTEQSLKIEAALALGATSRQAVSPILETALKRALIPLIDATKTTGIIFLPGAMVGMIIAGADPLEAVRLQIVVLYMLLGSVSIAAILVGTLSYRSFFTPRHQLMQNPGEGLDTSVPPPRSSGFPLSRE